MSKSREVVFLNESGVCVTSSRFIIGDVTYAIGLITSVRWAQKRRMSDSARSCIMVMCVPLLVVLIGMCALGFPSADTFVWVWFCWIFNFLVIVAFAAYLALRPPTYLVVVGTASGERPALASKDEEFIGRVIGALNHAIVER